MMDETTWAHVYAAAAALGVKPEAQRKWKERGFVPGRWHLALLRVAREKRLPLFEDDLELGRK